MMGFSPNFTTNKSNKKWLSTKIKGSHYYICIWIYQMEVGWFFLYPYKKTSSWYILSRYIYVMHAYARFKKRKIYEHLKQQLCKTINLRWSTAVLHAWISFFGFFLFVSLGKLNDSHPMLVEVTIFIMIFLYYSNSLLN